MRSARAGVGRCPSVYASKCLFGFDGRRTASLARVALALWRAGAVGVRASACMVVPSDGAAQLGPKGAPHAAAPADDPRVEERQVLEGLPEHEEGLQVVLMHHLLLEAVVAHGLTTIWYVKHPVPNGDSHVGDAPGLQRVEI